MKHNYAGGPLVVLFISWTSINSFLLILTTTSSPANSGDYRRVVLCFRSMSVGRCPNLIISFTSGQSNLAMTASNSPFSLAVERDLEGLTPSNTVFPGPPRVFTPNGTSISSAVFAGRSRVTDSLTDLPFYGNIVHNNPHLKSRAFDAA